MLLKIVYGCPELTLWYIQLSTPALRQAWQKGVAPLHLILRLLHRPHCDTMRLAHSVVAHIVNSLPWTFASEQNLDRCLDLCHELELEGHNALLHGEDPVCLSRRHKGRLE